MTILLLGLTLACGGGKSITKLKVADLVVELPDGLFDREDIDIDSVTQLGGGDAVAVVNVRVALKLAKSGDRWSIREIKLGDRQWERLEDILAALDRLKTERTESMLREIADAAQRYRKKHGSLPEFADYRALSDALSPHYLPKVIREDAWLHPLHATRVDAGTLRLTSVGPDGTLGTADDIVFPGVAR